MATYAADIDWKLAGGEDFLKGRYSRGHTLTFDGLAALWMATNHRAESLT